MSDLKALIKIQKMVETVDLAGDAIGILKSKNEHLESQIRDLKKLMKADNAALESTEEKLRELCNRLAWAKDLLDYAHAVVFYDNGHGTGGVRRHDFWLEAYDAGPTEEGEK